MGDHGPTLGVGMRRSRQREEVWAALHELSPHRTAEEIIAHVRRRRAGFPRSTVYRALDAMVEAGDATATRLDDGALRYELAATPHAHAICRRCGTVLHLDDLALRVAFQELTGTHRFTPERGELTVRGLCAACRDRDESPASSPLP